MKDNQGLNYRWFSKLITGKPHFVIYQDGQPYLIRRFLIPRNPHFNIYLHKFVKSDYDEALHDHPWWFLSLILKGAYTEHRPDGASHRKRGSIAFRRAEQLHRVELDWDQPSLRFSAARMDIVAHEKPVWTLFVTGSKVREWGFACPKGWMPWTKFTGGQHGEHRVGCGEYA